MVKGWIHLVEATYFNSLLPLLMVGPGGKSQTIPSTKIAAFVTWKERPLMHLDSRFSKVSYCGWCNNTDLNAKGFAWYAMYPGKFSLACCVVGTTILTGKLCTTILTDAMYQNSHWYARATQAAAHIPELTPGSQA